MAEKKTNSAFLSIVAAVNEEKVLADNLAASPMIRENKVPLFVERGYESAALAYNAGLERIHDGVVIFAHQDVYFPNGWEKAAHKYNKSLNRGRCFMFNTKVINYGII